ncbi:hypothetical protein DH2020_043815 [Rehmannia glutinosa]|uniref:GAGA-binding transcriptional activator n=1 Tax=Rehmannia glutinosa TaxID=99300 RepID=A0ABR0UJB0_REHGL
MDEDSLRNWGYYEPPHKGHLGLQLMSSMAERDTKPFLSGRDNPVMRQLDKSPGKILAYVPRQSLQLRSSRVVRFASSSHTDGAPSGPAKETRLNTEEPIIKKEGGPPKNGQLLRPENPKSEEASKRTRPKRKRYSAAQRSKTAKRTLKLLLMESTWILLVYRFLFARVPVLHSSVIDGVWGLAVCLLHHDYIYVPVANEHEKTWGPNCWTEDESGCV